MGPRVCSLIVLLALLTREGAQATTLTSDPATNGRLDAPVTNLHALPSSAGAPADQTFQPAAPVSYHSAFLTADGKSLLADSVLLAGVSIDEASLGAEVLARAGIDRFFEVATVPESASLTLLGIGLFSVGLSLRAFSRRARAKIDDVKGDSPAL